VRLVNAIQKESPGKAGARAHPDEIESFTLAHSQRHLSPQGPRRGEVGSRLRDPGEGDPSPECIHSPSPGMRAQGAPIPTSPLRGEVKSGCVNLIGMCSRIGAGGGR
jgi:hypothetical protein